MAGRGEHIRIYLDDEGPIRRTRWDWRARNGRILADSGEGYKNDRAGVKVASRLGAALGIDVYDDRPGR